MDGLDLQRAAEKERLYGAARNGTRADCLSGRVAGRASERRASGSEALRSDAERYPGCDPLFYEAGNKSASMKSIARVLRLQRPEDAENGYNAMVAAYNTDLKVKPAGVKKIHAILARTNPKLQAFKAETIIDDSLIQKIHASGY